MQARLLLEDGTVLTGKAWGGAHDSIGEVVFNTGITGYQEVLSDPSNAGHIIVMTQPSIGNYGLSRTNIEAIQPLVQGLVVREMAEFPSNWRGNYTLPDILNQYNIPAISDIDTRMLTRIIRKTGVQKGLITTSNLPAGELLAKLKDTKLRTDLVEQVSTKQMYTIPGVNEKIVVIDCGLKKGLLHELAKRGIHIVVVPYDTSFEEISLLQPDGIVLSNGPGNPQHVQGVQQTIRQLIERYPIFGIGLGMQLLALACGAETEAMVSGHRGNNQPVKDVDTGQCYITSQNHGYTVKADTLAGTRLQVTHINNHDQTIEGIKHLDYPVFAVQYHPEAAPGPLENVYLFDQFIMMIRKHQQSVQSVPLQARMYADVVKGVR